MAFAYLDGDFYESTLLSLRAVYPRMTRGAIAVIDDHGDLERNPRAWDGLPGVRRAADEFFADKAERLSVLVGEDLSFAYFRKGWADPYGCAYK